MNRKPVLIANRGEIAIRIARSCRALGFPSIAVYSDADKGAEYLEHADYAVGIGGVTPAESYLKVDKLLEVADGLGAGFVHPGYGFLSERASFVEACDKAGLIFVGPVAESMKKMGDKIEARATVDAVGVPRVPGSKGAVSDAREATRVAKEIGFPVLLKAAAGGGGKGMRRIDSAEELASGFESATREALSAFGDGSLYVEKLILEPHHVEIQVFGDGKGKAIHLGERECSIQRRHQKVWEESPAPILEIFPETRRAMFEAAVKLAEHVKYRSAGTFEFIVDGQGKFYFLEMNTRLQVEHPVTEWVTGVDLVAWQLLLAAGEFQLPKEAPARRGSAIEVRIYAEDPQTFLPSPGKIGEVLWPSGPFVRVDAAYRKAGEVSLNYDPMIAKLSVWASSRPEAVERLRVALDETRLHPPLQLSGAPQGSLRTNLSFLRRLVRCRDAIEGNTTTDLITRNTALTADPDLSEGSPGVSEAAMEAALAAAVFEASGGSQQNGAVSVARSSGWADTARWEGVSRGC